MIYDPGSRTNTVVPPDSGRVISPGEIVELDFESDPKGTTVKVRVPHGTRLGHWWVSLEPLPHNTQVRDMTDEPDPVETAVRHFISTLSFETRDALAKRLQPSPGWTVNDWIRLVFEAGIIVGRRTLP